ncbi:hypothetical protein ABLB84_07635 [Xenorhabdus szentirmaii]|uniref:Barstar (barnase inhibitor) domain-containing protein n=1 Tax=Xenorhabdus szentirmaii TaxID=290112 RepID=A0AAW3YQQ2_9GAMM|nr:MULTISPECIES: hypothetical protein [Xenorhabdus]MBD2799289.1 hypothetical protein [Xenorhabdus sp. M]PHM40757.1 hypothetical protein Xszus_00430 [Xenorhabdus szentirmaii]
MIDSQFHISINDEIFAIASDLDLFELNHYGNNDFELILLKSKEIEIQNSIETKQGDKVTLDYSINDMCVNSFEGNVIDKQSTPVNCCDFSLVIKTNDEHSIAIIVILKEWIKGNDLFYWRNNKCTEAKDLWLTASLYWQQIFPPEPDKILNASLDLNGVNNYLDFFCMLGEAFFGKHGYIGRDFHGFDDLLGDLSYRKSEINIYIKSIKKLKQFLERISPWGCNYYDAFMEITANRGCKLFEK